MKTTKKKTVEKVQFPYSMFPFLLIHSEGSDTKKCYFQCQSHVDKYLERTKLTTKEYKLYVKPGIETAESKPKKTKRKPIK